MKKKKKKERNSHTDQSCAFLKKERKNCESLDYVFYRKRSKKRILSARQLEITMQKECFNNTCRYVAICKYNATFVAMFNFFNNFQR